jgi:transposase
MTKHKTEDYKYSAVKYYLNNEKSDGYKKTCKIFDCKKSTLRDWIKRYNISKNLTRKNRTSISYKITKPQVKTALELLKQNEQLTMSELVMELKQEKIHGKTIIEWETELSKMNKKTLDITKFKAYIQKKSEINWRLFAFYEKYIFRKLRLQSYRNTKTSEQRMLNNFKRIFGNEKEVVICIGDYEQKQQMKYKEATKGKGMRTLFRKAGFQTYLVDEFRTSCKCSKCEGGSCIKNMVMKNPRPYRSGNVIVHGLICCKNGCGYWNRDVNGATNIYKIASNAINNKARPNFYLEAIIYQVI